jgi:hypothetical protein
MANTKISALTSATTPLAGTEVLPIVQSSATVKVATNDLTVRNIRANATTGILQVTGPAAASTRVATVPDANFTVARTDAGQTFTGANTFSSAPLVSTLTSGRVVTAGASGVLQDSASLSFDGTNLKLGTSTMPTVTGGQVQLIGDCLIFAGLTSIGSPYTQNLQIDITWGNWGSNPAIAVVEVGIAAREFGGTAGGAFGWLYALNGGGAAYNTFVTTGVTAVNGTLTASSGGNYILRITFDPTSQTDRIGYTIRIPTMSGGTGTSVSSISATLV